MIRPTHFPAALELARDHPCLQFVLDHLGKPPITSGELKPWPSGLWALAAEPNIAGKLSGLHTIASYDWTHEELAPYIDIALEAFSLSRLIFGSDWPVSSQAESYSRVCELLPRMRGRPRRVIGVVGRRARGRTRRERPRHLSKSQAHMI